MAQVEGLNLKMPGDLGSELALSRGPVMDPFATDFDGTDDRITTTYSTRRNLCRNPSFETNATGWGIIQSNVTGTAVAREAASWSGVDGSYAGRLTGTHDGTTNSGYSLALLQSMPVTVGTQYTGSAYVDLTTPGNLGTSANIIWWDVSNAYLSATAGAVTLGTGTTRLSVTGTAPVNAVYASIDVRTQGNVASASFSIGFDRVLFEAASSAGTYFPTVAQLDTGEAGWLGTAHASASDIGCFANGTTPRTFMGWAYRDGSGSSHTLFGGSNNGINGIFCRLASGSNDVQFFPNDGSPSTVWSAAWPGNGQWVHWALVFIPGGGSNNAELYINGVSKGAQTQAATYPTGSTLEIGSWAASQFFDGKQAWFSVHETILSAAQIANAASASDYETVVRSFGTVGIILPLNSKGGLTDASGNGRNGTAVGGVTVGAYSPGPLDTGTKWSLYELDLGNPSKREEMISSTDSDGSVPARVQKLENREVTFSVQLGDASSQDDAVAKIGALEAYLQKAEEVASQTVIDPANHVRLVYTPADSTQSFFLPIMFAEITSVPKTVEDGWFVNFPKVSVRCVCDPAGYGALRTYLDATTSADPAPSVTVPGGPGDLPPWIRTAVKDVAATARGLVRLSVKRGESSTTATVLASAMTPVAGTYSAPNMTTSSTSTDWSVLATTPRQTRQGTFKVYAHRVSQPGGGTPSLRLTWGEAGGSVRHNATVTGIDSSLRDVYLGEVTANASWDMWLETKGGVSLYSLILIPSDSFVETTSALPGEQMVGAVAIADPLQTTSTHIGGRTIPTGGGTWTSSVGSPNWPVSAANWARRSAVSMGSAAFAQAGTSNFMDHQIGATFRTSAFPTVGSGTPLFGIFARYVDASNYLVFGYDLLNNEWRLNAVVAGVTTNLWSQAVGPLSVNDPVTLRLQVVSDGRWSVFAQVYSVTYSVFVQAKKGSGSHPLLVSGNTLGSTSASKAGLYDFQPDSGAMNRDWKDFSISPLTGVTPAPITSGGTIRLAGPDMYGTDSQDYPYIGSSGLALSPGVNNNLTVMAQRSAVGHASTSTADTPALDLDIDGYPRYLSVPHA